MAIQVAASRGKIEIVDGHVNDDVNYGNADTFPVHTQYLESGLLNEVMQG